MGREAAKEMTKSVNKIVDPDSGVGYIPLTGFQKTSTEELERRYKAASDGIERGHLQIIWLLSQGRSAKFVAEVTGYTPTWVSKILWRYNDHGLAGLGDGRRRARGDDGHPPCALCLTR